MIFFQLQDQNARQIQNVPIILHVYKKNVRIHVIRILVDEMLNAKPRIIAQFVFVFSDM